MACGCLPMLADYRLQLCCSSAGALPREIILSNCQVNVSKKALGADGAKALANCLKSNATITQVRRWVVWACAPHAVQLRCAAARCQGTERRFLPWTKLFAKVAVQNLAANLIWVFVGVFCAMVVPWSVVVVFISICMTDTHDDALCCSAGALLREIIL